MTPQPGSERDVSNVNLSRIKRRLARAHYVSRSYCMVHTSFACKIEKRDETKAGIVRVNNPRRSPEPGAQMWGEAEVFKR